MDRTALATALGVLAALAAAGPARAGAWPAGPGSTYSEIVATSFSASRVAGGIETLHTTNSSVRLYSEVALTRRLSAVLNVPLLDHHAFGQASSTRFGDVTLGLRFSVAHGERWALASTLSGQIPTVSGERRLGTPYVNGHGIATFANDATGVGELQPGLLFSAHLGPLWSDLGAGYAARFGYVDQFTGAAQVWMPLAGGLSGTAGVHTRTNLTDPPSTAAVLANGVGESAEYVGWYGRLDYRLPGGVGVGIGYDSSLHLVDYPASSALSVRLSFSGRLWNRR
jgi:hypothetical protein